MKIRAHPRVLNPQGTAPHRAFRSRLRMQLAAGEITGFHDEAVKLKLADNPSTFYTPDFVVYYPDGLTTCFEVKALWKGRDGAPDKAGYRDDARTKVRIAAGLFPLWTFVVAASRAPWLEWQFETLSAETT